MTRVRIVHLLDDLALGGVTRNLALFEKPEFVRKYDSTLRKVNPSWSRAPVLNTDMIFVHFPPSWNNLLFLWSLRMRNPQSHLVWIEHSYHRDWEALTVPNKSRFHKMLRIAASLFDNAICVSAAQEKWLREILGDRTGFFYMIHPWSDLSGLDQVVIPRFSPARSITIGAYGRLSEAKGFAELIRAVKMIGKTSKIYLNIGGYGEEEVALRQITQECANIRFCGKVDDVAEFLSRCDVVAVPSLFESFGLVATEAKMAGRPVIVSAVGGLPEQVGNGGIVTDCSNLEEFSRCLQNLQSLPLTKMAMAARGEAKMAEYQRTSSWLSFLREASDPLLSRSVH